MLGWCRYKIHARILHQSWYFKRLDLWRLRPKVGNILFRSKHVFERDCVGGAQDAKHGLLSSSVSKNFPTMRGLPVNPPPLVLQWLTSLQNGYRTSFGLMVLRCTCRIIGAVRMFFNEAISWESRNPRFRILQVSVAFSSSLSSLYEWYLHPY